MSDGRSDSARRRRAVDDQNGDNSASSRAHPRRPHESLASSQTRRTTDSPPPARQSSRVDRAQTLQRLAEAAQRISSPANDSIDGDFLEATMLATENRARALERSSRGLEAEIINTLERVRPQEATVEGLTHQTGSRSSADTTAAISRNARPFNAADYPFPGLITSTSESRSDARTSQTRGGEWFRLNSPLASQEYERFRSRFLERRDRVLASTTGAQSSTNSVTSNPAATTGPGNLFNAAEQSASARRDLERALRDYRVARRALRNHYNSESSSPADQNNPSYQSIMAQITEQRDRNRVRARGHSRLNTLERSDMIVNDIAAAAGVGHDVWRSDNEDDSFTSSASRLAALNRGLRTDARDPPRANPARPSGTARSDVLYLGPTTAGSNDITALGGMREHYQRLQDRRGSSGTTNSPGLDAVTGAALDATIGSESRFRRRAEGEQSQRLNETIDRFSDTLLRLQDKEPVSAATSYKSKAKNMLKYLTLLNGLDNDSEKSLDWAKQLGCDSLAESLVKQTDVDLPLRVEELPSPHVSSWIDNGMSWTGVQKGGSTKSEDRYTLSVDAFASGPLFESGSSIEDRILHLRAWRHRERIRAERLERERSARGSSSWWRSHGADTGLLRGLSSGSETLADVERHLSDLLEDEERRLGRNGGDGWSVSDSTRSRSGTGIAASDREQHEDKWPVKVMLHEVDWQNMSVFGTMVASHIPERITPPTATVRNNVATGSGTQYVNDAKNEDIHSMETFFDGEIIDFRRHELETVTGKPGYRVGGLETDIRYWSRIGPFREAVDKAAQRCRDKKVKNLTDWSEDCTETSEEHRRKIKELRESINASVDTDNLLDEADLETVVDETMAECLGSRKWLEKAMGENGWVLMRWKERCFVKPSSAAASANESTYINSSPPTARSQRRSPPFYVPSSASSSSSPFATTTTAAYTTTYADSTSTSNPTSNDHRNPSWGLTIRGFYYVAVHRRTGHIEALYYDSGSQPFQELKMRPLRTAVLDGDESSGGVRSEFGSYQFR